MHRDCSSSTLIPAPPLARQFETVFNDCYNNEHASVFLTVPEVYTALRKANDSKTPEWLALYDLKSPSSVTTPEFQQLRNNASDNERYVLRQIELLQRRIYSKVSEWTLESAGKSATGPGSEENESVELVAKVPGWVRGRRYELLDAADVGHNNSGPGMEGGKRESPAPVKFLNIHEFNQPGYMESEEMKAVTVRAEKLKGSVKGYEVRSFELYRDFGKQ
ncbi:hypothetical protein AX16_004808 [Volvariella volvacea WC 439]|nr:hypothetical protein AX16_004808 [Volvariella volvacea WC 439]